MDSPRRVVIIGNGIAGVLVAARVRFLEPDPTKVSLDIWTREPHDHYSRIRLPEVFAKEMGADALRTYNPEWYASRAIGVHRGREIVSVDRGARRIVAKDGQSVEYDELVLCPGSEAVRLGVPGADLAGVFTVREYGDADAIRRYLGTGERQAVVVGGGLLGLEAAHFLQTAGVTVTLLEKEGRLLPRQLDEVGSRLLRAMVTKPRCAVVVGAEITGLLGEARVRAVKLRDGSEIGSQTVLVTAGIAPRVELARAAGLQVGVGVVVDETLRSSDPNIWAAGDVVEFRGVTWGIIPAAMEHASVVAANLLGRDPVRYHKTIPRNTLKVAGIELESMGEVDVAPGRGVAILTHLDEARGHYEKYVLRDGALAGCILLGSRENHEFASEHIGRATTEEEIRARLR
jgi:nitrite reductase (NADH) large subunit